MEAFQNGVAALAKLRGGEQQQVTVVHQHVQVAGGNVAVAGQITREGGADGGGATRNGDQPHAKQIEDQPVIHAPLTAMPCTDAEKDPVPVTGDAKRQVPDAWRHVSRRTKGK
jgi:hypothetical protein